MCQIHKQQKHTVSFLISISKPLKNPPFPFLLKRANMATAGDISPEEELHTITSISMQIEAQTKESDTFCLVSRR